MHMLSELNTRTPSYRVHVRRLIPVQYLLGACLLALSFVIEEWLSLGSPTAIVERGRLLLLTGVCMALVFLACTQDIAVDAWAISLLSRKNVGAPILI